MLSVTTSTWVGAPEWKEERFFCSVNIIASGQEIKLCQFFLNYPETIYRLLNGQTFFAKTSKKKYKISLLNSQTDKLLIDKLVKSKHVLFLHIKQKGTTEEFKVKVAHSFDTINPKNLTYFREMCEAKEEAGISNYKTNAKVGEFFCKFEKYSESKISSLP